MGLAAKHETREVLLVVVVVVVVLGLIEKRSCWWSAHAVCSIATFSNNNSRFKTHIAQFFL